MCFPNSLTIFWRSYDIINENYFCVHHKNWQKHNQYFKLSLFTIKLTLCHIKPNIKLNLSLTSSISLVFLPLEMQKRLKQTKAYHIIFLLCLKRKNLQNLRNGSYRNPFLQCVCYWYNLLQWMSFILYDNWKTLIFIKVYSLLRYVVSFFEAGVLKDVQILCVISTITRVPTEK